MCTQNIQSVWIKHSQNKFNNFIEVHIGFQALSSTLDRVDMTQKIRFLDMKTVTHPDEFEPGLRREPGKRLCINPFMELQTEVFQTWYWEILANVLGALAF